MTPVYTVTITSDDSEIDYTRTFHGVSLPRLIRMAHSKIDALWYDESPCTTGHLTITNLYTGETCWESTITPYEE